MAELYDLSRTDAANVDEARLGFPENMARSDVNDRERALEGATRRWYEDPQWTQLLLEQGGATFTVSKISDTVVRIASGLPTTDVSGKFPIGTRVRVSISGASAVAGHVSAVVFGSPNTDVTIAFPRIARSEVIASTATKGTGGSPASFSLANLPVVAGSVRISDSAVHVGANALRDNGAGVLTHPADGNVGTINYVTGAVVVNGLLVAFDANVTVTYDDLDVVPGGVNRIETYFARDLRDAAFRETGIGNGQVPLAHQLGAAAFATGGAGNGLDADTVDGFHATGLIEASAEATGAILTNPGFAHWPYGRTFVAGAALPNNDAQMTACQWRLLSQNNNRWEVFRDPATDAAAPLIDPPFSYYSLYLQASAANPAPPNSERGGVWQNIESREARRMRGKSVSFSIYARSTGLLGAFRMAVLYWTGAIDGPAADPISNWNTPGVNPTLVANWTYAGSAAKTPTGAWVRYTLENVAIPSNAVNVAVFVWVDTGQSNPGDQLWLTGAQLEIAARATPLRLPRLADDQVRCQRFALSSFWNTTIVGQNLGAGTGPLFAQNVLTIQPPGMLFRTPTVTTFNPIAANANWASGGVPTVTAQRHFVAIRAGGADDSIHFLVDAGF